MSWLSIRFKEMVTASFMLYLINCIVLLTTTLFKENRLLNSLNITRKCTGGYVPMANNDYLKKMSKSGEWGDHVTLQAAADWGLLAFYGLPLPHTLVQLTVGVPTSMPAGVKYEVQTFPVDSRAIVDGDGMTVYVKTTDPRESSCVPIEVQVAVIQRSQARAEKNYIEANAIHKKIIESGYWILDFQNNKETLARKYRI
ncbi:staphylococcal-like nuclease CAN2 isoform X2 [Quercus suber]|uniref:staphylococcal-like nuclease CAN2 isoform X2 n=1 Tax=Quercus suber TaxID=58331 RepID=UPI0032DF06F0